MPKHQKPLKDPLNNELISTISMLFEDLLQRTNNLYQPITRHPYQSIVCNLKHQQNKDGLAKINLLYQSICFNISSHQKKIEEKNIQEQQLIEIMVRCDEKTIHNWFKKNVKFSEKLSHVLAQNLVNGRQCAQKIKQLSNLLCLSDSKKSGQDIVKQVKLIQSLNQQKISFDKVSSIFSCCIANKLSEARQIVKCNITKDYQQNINAFFIQLESTQQNIKNFTYYLSNETFKYRDNGLREWNNSSNQIMEIYQQVKGRTQVLYNFVQQIESEYQGRKKLDRVYGDLTYSSKLKQLLKVLKGDNEYLKKLEEIKTSYEELMFKIEQINNRHCRYSYLNSKRKKINMFQFKQQCLKQFQNTIDQLFIQFTELQKVKVGKEDTQLKQLKCKVSQLQKQKKKMMKDNEQLTIIRQQIESQLNQTKNNFQEERKKMKMDLVKDGNQQNVKKNEYGVNQKKIKKLTNQINQFKERQQKFQQRQQELKKQGKTKQLKIETLQKCQEQLLNDIQKIKKQKQKQINDIKQQILSLKSQNEEKSNKYLLDIKQKSDRNDKLKQQYRAEQNRYKLKIKDLQSNLKLKDKQIQKFSAQLSNLKQQIKQLDIKNALSKKIKDDQLLFENKQKQYVAIIQKCKHLEQKLQRFRLSIQQKQSSLAQAVEIQDKLKNNLVSKDQTIVNLNQQISQFKDKIVLMEETNRKLCEQNKKIKQLEQLTAVIRRQSQLKQILWESKRNEWDMEKGRYSQRQLFLEGQVKKLTIEKQKKEDKIQKSQKQISRLSSDLKIMEGLMYNLYEDKNTTQETINILRKEKADSSNLILTYQEEKIQANNKLMQKTTQSLQLENNVRKLNKSLNQEKEMFFNYQKNSQAEKQEMQTQIQKLKLENQEIEKKQFLIQQQIKKIKSQAQIFQHKKLEAIGQLQMTKSAVQQFDFYKKMAKDCPQLNLDGFVLCYIDRFFHGEMLQRETLHKYRLLSHVQRLMKQKVIKTNLCFKFDSKNKASFHEYIDGKSNILAVAKSQNGAFVAGFYSGQYADKIAMTERALIVSLLQNEAFELNPPSAKQKTIYRGMVYDKFYLIFGNSEIRIKIGDKMELFSNFGISNSYFDSRGFRVNALFGEGQKRELCYSAVQIYELVFQQQCSEIKSQLLFNQRVTSSKLKQQF